MDDKPISQYPGQPSRQTTHIPLCGKTSLPVLVLVPVAADLLGICKLPIYNPPFFKKITIYSFIEKNDFCLFVKFSRVLFFANIVPLHLFNIKAVSFLKSSSYTKHINTDCKEYTKYLAKFNSYFHINHFYPGFLLVHSFSF
jgi:hypothetical protein